MLTAPKKTEDTAISTGASGITIAASCSTQILVNCDVYRGYHLPLLPPNSSILLPNLDMTALPTAFPTRSLPVKDTGTPGLVGIAPHNQTIIPRSISRLFTKDTPISSLPVTRPATAPGKPFFSKTFEIIDVTAMEHRGVVGEGFHIVAFPAARDKARFLYLRILI